MWVPCAIASLVVYDMADRLGYRYVWQTDDDSRMKEPVDFNMREYLQQRGLLMAAARWVA